MKKSFPFILAIVFSLSVAFTLSGCSLFARKPNDTPKEEEVYVRVSYTASGGYFSDGEIFKSTEVLAGGKITPPEDPTRPDCIFMGWGTDNTLPETLIDPETFIVPKDEEWIRLFAQWKPTTEDKLLTLEGKAVEKNESEFQKVVPETTETYSLSDKFTYSEGSVLEVKYKGNDVTGGSITLDPGDNVLTVNVCSPSKARVNTYTYNIHRSHEITVTYMNGYYELYTDTVYSGYEYTVYCPVEVPGYDFESWKQGKTEVEKIVPMSNVTLDAVLKPKTYTVTYETDGGECSYTTDEVKYGDKYTLPKVSKEGSTFDGWYCGDTLIGYERDSRKYEYIEDITVTAHWKVLSYKISVYANTDIFEQLGTVSCGGKYGLSDEITLDHGEEVTISATIKTGYVFIGWYESITSNTVKSYEPVLTFTVKKTEGFVAKWKPISDFISAYSNVGGVVLPETASFVEGITVRTKYPSLSPLTFAGWYRSNNPDNCLSDSTEYSLTLSPDYKYELEAKWEGEGMDKFYIVTQDGVNFSIGGLVNPDMADVVIPDYISSISGNVFENNQSIVRLTLGKGITSFDGNFKTCHKLVEIRNLSGIDISGTLAAQNALRVVNDESTAIDFDYKYGYIFYDDGDKTYLLGYSGKSANLPLPNDYNGKPYEIYKYAFYGTAVTQISIAKSTLGIGEYAFANCEKLGSIVYDAADIPDFNGDSHFADNSGGTRGITVFFAEDVKRVPAYLFYSSSARAPFTLSVDFANDCPCTEIGAYAFYTRGLVYACVPRYVRTIGNRAYSGLYLDTIDYYAEDAEVNNSFIFAGTSTDFGLTLNVKGTVRRLPSDVASNHFEMNRPKVGAVNLSEGVEAISGLSYTDIKTITIPSTVTSISGGIFHGCSQLTKIYYNAVAATIGNAVAGSTLFGSGDSNSVTIHVGTSVRTIPTNFGDSNITSIIFDGDGCTKIENFAFYGSPVSTLTLPSTIETIEYSAFQNMKNLTSINIPSSVKSLGKSLFVGCNPLVVNFDAEEIEECDADFAKYASITLNIGQSVRKLPSDSFGAGIVSVIFGDTIEGVTVCENAFNCPDLTSLYLGGKDIVLEKNAFTFGASVVSLTYNAVSGLDTEGDIFACAEGSSVQITVGKLATRIPAKFFYVSGEQESPINISKITFTSGTANGFAIGSYAFAGLGSVNCIFTVEKFVSEIGEKAFYGTTFKSVTYDTDLCGDFDDYVFEDMSISIGSNVIRLPSKLAVVRNGSKSLDFDKASNLTTIGSHSVSGYNLTTFYDAHKLKVLEPYALADGNSISTMSDIINDVSQYVPVNIETIGAYAFSGVSGAAYFVKINLPNVKSIGEYAFKDCTVGTISLGGTFTSIPVGCFSGCTNLSEFEIANSVQEIGAGAFSGCTKLTSVTFKVVKSWKIGNSSLSESSLSQKDVAAQYLTVTHVDKKWTRN